MATAKAQALITGAYNQAQTDLTNEYDDLVAKNNELIKLYDNYTIFYRALV